jgi:hypothetical protein
VRARLLAIFSPFLSAGFLAGAVLAQAGEQQYDGPSAQQKQTTTGTTTTPDTTSAGTQSADELRAGDEARAAGFSCVEIVEISQSASRDQYNFSAARLQECLAREVIDDVKGDRLADTGGASLLPIAGCILAGLGLFVGRALFSRRER